MFADGSAIIILQAHNTCNATWNLARVLAKATDGMTGIFLYLKWYAAIPAGSSNNNGSDNPLR